MKISHELSPSCYYMFESLSSGNSCYFESEEEVQLFERLFKIHMDNYVTVHKMYLSSEGYQLLVKIRERRTLLNNFRRKHEKKGKEMKHEYVEKPWKIVSEQMRIMLSSYVRIVNKLRSREGVLVKKSYTKYIFSSEDELKAYVEEKERACRIACQRNKRYRPKKSWKKLVRWAGIRGKDGAVRRSIIDFGELMLCKLVRRTLKAHSLTPPPS